MSADDAAADDAAGLDDAAAHDAAIADDANAALDAGTLDASARDAYAYDALTPDLDLPDSGTLPPIRFTLQTVQWPIQLTDGAGGDFDGQRPHRRDRLHRHAHLRVVQRRCRLVALGGRRRERPRVGDHLGGHRPRPGRVHDPDVEPRDRARRQLPHQQLGLAQRARRRYHPADLNRDGLPDILTIVDRGVFWLRYVP